MNVRQIYDRARELGFRLEPRSGGRLAVIPGDNVPPDLVDALKAHKGELLAWLSPPCPGWQAVPPSDLPLVRRRPDPRPQDRERVIAYLRRQAADRPGRLSAWLVKRESDYFAGPGRKWDCGFLAYAAARDAGCWQLNRSESELWEFLAATHEIAHRLDERPGPP